MSVFVKFSHGPHRSIARLLTSGELMGVPFLQSLPSLVLRPFLAFPGLGRPAGGVQEERLGDVFPDQVRLQY